MPELIHQISFNERHTVNEEIYFLLIASAGCKSCIAMKKAFKELEDTNRLQRNVYIMELSEGQELGKGVSTFMLKNIPTLLFFGNGNEQRRWGGFFNCPFDEAVEKLSDVLTEATDSWHREAEKREA